MGQRCTDRASVGSQVFFFIGCVSLVFVPQIGATSLVRTSLDDLTCLAYDVGLPDITLHMDSAIVDINEGKAVKLYECGHSPCASYVNVNAVYSFQINVSLAVSVDLSDMSQAMLSTSSLNITLKPQTFYALSIEEGAFGSYDANSTDDANQSLIETSSVAATTTSVATTKTMTSTTTTTTPNSATVLMTTTVTSTVTTTVPSSGPSEGPSHGPSTGPLRRLTPDLVLFAKEEIRPRWMASIDAVGQSPSFQVPFKTCAPPTTTLTTTTTTTVTTAVTTTVTTAATSISATRKCVGEDASVPEINDGTTCSISMTEGSTCKTICPQGYTQVGIFTCTLGEMVGQSLCMAPEMQYAVQNVYKIAQRLDIRIKIEPGKRVSEVKEAFKLAISSIYSVDVTYVQKLIVVEISAGIVQASSDGHRVDQPDRGFLRRRLSEAQSRRFDVQYEITVPPEEDWQEMLEKTGTKLGTDSDIQQQFAETLQHQSNITLEDMVATVQARAFEDKVATTMDGKPLDTETFYEQSGAGASSQKKEKAHGALIGGLVSAGVVVLIAVVLVIVKLVQGNILPSSGKESLESRAHSVLPSAKSKECITPSLREAATSCSN